MHVLILALRTGVIKTKFAKFFFAKWLSRSFDQTILEKKEQRRRPSYPPIFGSLKRQLELLIFMNVFISKHKRIFQINLLNKLLYSYIFITYMRVSPLRQCLALYTKA